jgi:radical SAM protein with 4Fe4S-binding SPASM domain
MGIAERIDAITGIPAEYRAEILPPPRSVKIELTGRCNFACSFCARSMMLRDQKDMDQAMFERIALEMRQAGVEELGLFYLGESMMCRWLVEAVQYAKNIGYPYVFLTTNGSLSTPAKLEAVMAAGLDSLKFSLNYADVDQFTEIAKVKPKLFHNMMKNIKAAKGIRDKGGYSCGIYGSYIAYDGDQGARMKAMLDDISPYLDEIYALPLYNQADHVTAEEEKRGWDITAGNRGRLDALRDPLPCWSIFTEGHVTWDGRLSACCFDHDGKFDMGDLTKIPFVDAWNSERFQKLRRAHLAKDVSKTVCSDCIAYQ